MASPPLLDLDVLLSPIAADKPAGDPLPFAIRAKLDDLRKEIDPNQFDPDDPLRPEAPKKADWQGIVRTAQDTLAKTSKDLLVAVRLTEALVKQNGFAGLRDSLQLLRRLLVDCWDRLLPPVDDGDLDIRAAPFNWLDDTDRGGRFPTTLRMVPLVAQSGQWYTWQNWREMQDGKKGAPTADKFEKAIGETPYEQCQTLADDITACQQELQQLEAALAEKLAGSAPGMSMVRKAVEDCQGLILQILKKKGPPPAAPSPAPAADGQTVPEYDEAAPGQPRVAAPRLASREDVYRQLNDAAALLQRLEPHSPIPYLIQRAIELGAMPFPKLMRALIRDENVLTEMNRELGIKEEKVEEEHHDD